MKKALKITGITLISLIVLLAIIPFAFEGKIYEIVQKKANENLNATVSFTDVDLSLLRNFPHLRVSIEGLKVVNKAPFDSVKLAQIENFTVLKPLSISQESNLGPQRYKLCALTN